ncbi:sugar phosphate nucleotidyltransferase [Actinoallomurus acanthiterrae]
MRSTHARTVAAVVLAGGSGNRLRPLTDRSNKHLLPVGGEPLVVRAVRQLVAAGVRDVLVVIDDRHAGAFMGALEDGAALGLRSLAYAWQPPGGGGMPTAIGAAEHRLCAEKFLVACGDVLTDADLGPVIDDFLAQTDGARMTAVRTADTAGYSPLVTRGAGVAGILDKDSRRHLPGLVDLGFYLYHHDVFEVIQKLPVSARGETEIWDLNRVYAERGLLEFSEVSGWWADVGASVDVYMEVKRRYGG